MAVTDDTVRTVALPSRAARAPVPAAPPVDADGRSGQREFLGRLVASGDISNEAATRALGLLAQAQVHVLAGLLRLNAIAEHRLYDLYADYAGLPLLHAEPSEVQSLAANAKEAAAALGLAEPWLKRHGAMVFRRTEGYEFACRDALANDALALFCRKTHQTPAQIKLHLVPPSLYDELVRQRSNEVEAAGAKDDLRTLRELAEEGPTIELVNAILSQAVTQRASDIHIEPAETDFHVRVRVDGEMLLQTMQPRDRFDAVACRVKILANLDIAERRLPQDGRINARVNGESFDIRVSVLPGSLGESIVLRLLRQERKPTRLQDLGMNGQQAAAFEAWAALANGIVLVTGPTGSGKSTTLYTALELANDRTKKIITIEDPVEYKVRGITQLQVNADIGFTFASALRSILRHDPDIILVGEIRDEETARIAIQSSLTGHMVLSTLHTNSAIGAITRLIDMGIEPFLIAASVRGLMAQRLVRRLCPKCALPDTTPDEATATLIDRWRAARPDAPVQLHRVVGCAHCAGTGYYGRFAIYDLIEIDRHLAHSITQGASEANLLAMVGQAEESGLLRSGVDHIAQGHTTLAEVLRATGGT